jgi:CHAT domain
VRYDDFTLLLSAARETADALSFAVQAIDVGVIEPIASQCALATLRIVSESDPTRPPDRAALFEAGAALGHALLPGAIETHLRRRLEIARSGTGGLRLRIRATASALMRVPWEYALLPPPIGEATLTDFLALMPRVSIVRDQAIAPMDLPPAPHQRLRILGVAAAVGGIAVDEERRLLDEQLAGGRSVALAWPTDGRRPTAAHGPAQMFHFAGHGDFGTAIDSAGGAARDFAGASDASVSGEGTLVFAGDSPDGERITGDELGVTLRELGVRVAVMNGCRTASRDTARVWSSVAAALLKAGVSSVVGMQHRILDGSAVAFAAAFYRAVAAGASLDDAVHAGRVAIFDVPDAFGWGTPVLHLCTGSGGDVFPEAALASRVFVPEVITKNIDRFTGRTWLLKRVREWLEHGSERVLLLTGAPGTGKSMVAAWLSGLGPDPDDPAYAADRAAIRRRVAAFHFCVADSGSIVPSELAASVAAQLVANVPGFAPPTGTTRLDDERAFHELVRKPLRDLANRDPIVIVIDSLDEAAGYTGATTIVRLVAGLTDLPANVRILATTRPDDTIVSQFPLTTPIDLIADSPADHDDVHAYALHRLADAALASLVAKLSDGNFLYAHLVLEDRETLDALASNPGAVPKGLPGLYTTFLNRVLGPRREAWPEIRPILGAIAVARGSGLSRIALAGIAGSDPADAMTIARQYLQGPDDGPFRVFHKSFADFLVDDAPPIYRLDAAEMHGRVADYFLVENAGVWSACTDRYALDHTAAHLIAAYRSPRREVRDRRAAQVNTLLTDLGYLSARIDNPGEPSLRDLIRGRRPRSAPPNLEGLYGTIRDLHDAIATSLASPVVRDLARVVDREAVNFRRWDREAYPALFAQQVHNRGVLLELREVTNLARAYLATLGRPYLALRWNQGGESVSLVRSIEPSWGPIERLQWLPDQKQVVAMGPYGIQTFELATGRGGPHFSFLVERRRGLVASAFTDDATRYVILLGDVGEGNTTLEVVDAANNKVLAARAMPARTAKLIAIAAHDDVVLVGSDRGLAAWNYRHDALVTLASIREEIYAITLAADGRTAIASWRNGNLAFYDVRSATEIGSVQQEDPANRLLITGDGRKLITASPSSLCIYELADRRLMGMIESPSAMSRPLAATRDGMYVVSSTHDLTLVMWHVPSGDKVRILRGHQNTIETALVGADETTLVSADAQFIRVWAGRLETRVEPIGHVEAVCDVIACSDRQRVMSRSEDGAIKIWDLATGAEVRTFTTASEPDGFAGFDGQRVIARVPTFEDRVEIAALNVDTGDSTTLVDLPVSADAFAVLSRDGRWLVLAQPRDAVGDGHEETDLSLIHLEPRSDAIKLAIPGRLTQQQLEVIGRDHFAATTESVQLIWHCSGSLLREHLISPEADERSLGWMRITPTHVVSSSGGEAIRAVALAAWAEGAVESLVDDVVACTDDARLVAQAVSGRAVTVERTSDNVEVALVILDGDPQAIDLDATGRILVIGDAGRAVCCFELVGDD